MTVFFDTSAALDSNLNDMVGLPPVAWENIKYQPVDGTLYIRPTLIPATTVVGTIGDAASTDLNTGLYQVDIFSPADKGKNEAMLMADLIADQFARDKELVYNGRTTIIKSTSQRTIDISDGWYHFSIDINYYSFTGRR